MIMTNAGSALMGIGYASGEGRARHRGPRRDLEPAARGAHRGRPRHPAQHRRRQRPRPVRGQRGGRDHPRRRPPRRQHHLRRGHRRRDGRRGARHRHRRRLRPVGRAARRRRPHRAALGAPRRRRRVPATTTTSTWERRRLRRPVVPEVGGGPRPRAQGGARTAYIVATSVADGDLAISSSQPGLEARRRKVVDLPWTWMRQVHGATVRPGHRARRARRRRGGRGCDRDSGCSARGAGRRLRAGRARRLRRRGRHRTRRLARPRRRHDPRNGRRDGRAVELRGVIGPCIHAECYEFGAADLDVAAAAAGERVRSRTNAGMPALDLVAGVEDQLHACGVELVPSPWAACTAHTPGYWSHRARGDASARRWSSGSPSHDRRFSPTASIGSATASRAPAATPRPSRSSR